MSETGGGRGPSLKQRVLPNLRNYHGLFSLLDAIHGSFRMLVIFYVEKKKDKSVGVKAVKYRLIIQAADEAILKGEFEN